MSNDTPTIYAITPENITAIQTIQQSKRGWIAQLIWSPDGRLFAAASAGGVAIWRGSMAAQPVFIKQHNGPVKSLAFAPNSSTLATASADTTIKVWDLRAYSPTMQPIETHTDHTDSVDHVLLARNGAVISGSVDGTVRIRHALRNFTLTAHTGEVNTLAMSHTHRIIASGGRDNTVRLWDVVKGRALSTLHAHNDWIRVLAFHPTEDILLSASRDGTARLWDVSDPANVVPLAAFQHEGDVRAATFDATGTMIATGSTFGNISVWDATTGARMTVLEQHIKPVVALVFHPQNHFLASGGGDNTIYLWGVTQS